ncbi:MAG: response regulator transcription factor [Lentimicrobium sp.]|jgi:DNA-binding response OmpR family regulator|nr:response regulator transcription factor [Lentimicrobium sp.]
MDQKAKILLVEDDHNLSSVLLDYLELLGYKVTLATDGEQGLEFFQEDVFDLCILDIMLPRKDGLTLAADIRQINQQTPIIFLTALGQSENRIDGFKAGCDDYIAKPFSSEELSFRIEAILKRCMNKNMRPRADIFTLGSLLFDSGNMLLIINDKEKKLTPKENALLKLLCLNQNNLLSRDQALSEIWGSTDYFFGRSMDVFITRLRKYLKDEPAVSIQNVHGTGFRLEVRQ